jgi:hypothetical protein
MSSFQIVTCEEKEYACGSAYLTWQDDCKCFRAKIESDPKPELLKQFGFNFQVELQKVLGGEITPLNVESVASRLGEVLMAAGIYDDCSTSFLSAQSGINTLPIIASIPAISVGADQMIQRLKNLLKAVVVAEGNLRAGLVKVETCISECAKLGTLSTKISFIGPGQAAKLNLDTASLVTLCDCGARPVALSGTTVIVIVL